MNISETKEVYFHEYCPKCDFKDLDESKDPCNECLGTPHNNESHIPINYKGEKPTTKKDWVKKHET